MEVGGASVAAQAFPWLLRQKITVPDRVAGYVHRDELESRAELVGTEELRFSKAEAARFFDLKLSRSDLAAEMDRTVGWPFALRVSHNRMEGGTGGSTGVVQEFVKNWVESRLFADLGRDDRDFLLDIGLFGWMDAATPARTAAPCSDPPQPPYSTATGRVR